MPLPKPNPQFFRRERLFFWGAFLAVFFLPLTGWVLNRIFQPLPFADHDDEEPQAWLKREEWLNQGRKSPDALPAAAHWLAALQQAHKLPVVRAGSAPRPSGARPLAGAPPAPPPLGGCDWTEQGPSPLVDGTYGKVSGRVTDLVPDLTSDPTGNTLYLAAAYGGVWKTTNGLSASPSFTPISDIHQSLAMGAIGVDASVTPPILYVGTGEINQAGDSYYGTGILKSVDGGNSWTLTTTANSGAISLLGLGFSKILVDPANPATVLAGAAFSICCDPGITQTNMGLYISTDAGNSWTHQATIGSHSCTDLVYDPSNQTYYAGIRGVGVYKSIDHGTTWTLCASPFVGGTPPSLNNFGRVSLAVRGGKLWALFTDNNTSDLSTPSASDTGLAESDDNGATWNPVAVPNVPGGSLVNAGFGAQGEYDQYLAAPPSSTALLAGGIDLWKANTVNGTSTTWANLSSAYTGNPHSHPDQHAFAAVNANTWYMGNDGGVWSTTNAGAAIHDLNTDLGTIQFVSASPDPSALGAFIGGAQDNGTSGTTGGTTWNEAFGGDGGYTDVNPSTLGQYYGEHFLVGLYRLDNFGSAFVTVVDGSTIPDNSAFYVPYKVVPGAGPTVVYGTSRIWEGPGTASLGAGWNPISPNLAGNAGQYITGLDVSASNLNTIYAAFTDPGAGTNSVYMTANGGGSWANISTGLPAGRPVKGISVDPTNPLKAYLGVQGFALANGSGHVFMTLNGGSSWTDITGSLPDAPVNSVLVDPLFPGDLYVGTDVGVFATQDNGATWSQMGTLLPESAVFQLKLSVTCPRVLTAATYGRGAWTICPLDNQVCPANTPTNTPTSTASFTPTPTATLTPTVTPSFTPSSTPTLTPSFTPTFTASLTPSASPTKTATATPTLTPSVTPTATIPNTLAPVLFPNPLENGPAPQLQLSFASTVHSLQIKAYTTSFRRVKEWDSQEVPAGVRDLPWDAVDQNGIPLANGLYYVVVQADTNRWVVKWLILR